MVVVEVDGDLDNRACITDKQEARKERKDSRTRQKKYVWLTIEKNPSVCIFLCTFDQVLRAVNSVNNVPPPIDDELPKIRLNVAYPVSTYYNVYLTYLCTGWFTKHAIPFLLYKLYLNKHIILYSDFWNF